MRENYPETNERGLSRLIIRIDPVSAADNGVTSTLANAVASDTRVDIKFSIHACWAGLRETAGSSVGSTMAIEYL